MEDFNPTYFPMLKSYYEAALLLNTKDRASFFTGIITYYMTGGEVVEMTATAYAIFVAIRPTLDGAIVNTKKCSEGGKVSGKVRKAKMEEKKKIGENSEIEENRLDSSEEAEENSVSSQFQEEEETEAKTMVQKRKGTPLKKTMKKKEPKQTEKEKEKEKEKENDKEKENGRRTESGLLSSESSDFYSKILKEYHRCCPSLGKVVGKNAKRKKLVEDLGVEYSLETIVQVFEMVEGNDFLCGRTGKKEWKAHFDWLVKMENINKILQGNYAPYEVKSPVIKGNTAKLSDISYETTGSSLMKYGDYFSTDSDFILSASL